MTLENDKIAFITLTNWGYINYTLNCLKSLEKSGSGVDLLCYAIGDQAFNRLGKLGYSARLIPDEARAGLQKFRRGDWTKVIIYKFDIIHEQLLHKDYVCFTDGDVVFRNKNILSYCLERIGDHDLLIQNDRLSDTDHENLCTGFMFIRSNKKTLEIFNPATVRMKKSVGHTWDDQVYINSIRNQLNFAVLPLDLFPNGIYFRQHQETLDPMLIHFNHLLGHRKSIHMLLSGCVQSAYLTFLFLRHVEIRYGVVALSIFIKRKIKSALLPKR